MNKLALLSNINMAPAQNVLSTEGWDEPYICEYGQHLRDLLDPGSSLNTGQYHTVWVHLDAQELFKDLLFTLPDAEQLKERWQEVTQAIQAWQVEHPSVNVIVSNLVLPPSLFTNFLEPRGDFSFSNIEQQLNQSLSELKGVHVLDAQRLFRLYGYQSLCDEKYWYLGRIRYTNLGFECLCRELKRLDRAVAGKVYKVLVCDLDNVLWGGIVGENGVNGVELSEDGVGKVYRDVQKTIRALKQLGVLLTINSKNNEDDVREIFAKNRMMALAWEDFVVPHINWNNKAENMQAIAGQLNLGTDSLVFIDDSPQERMLIRETMPEVAVPDFPRDVAQLQRWLVEDVIYEYFGRVELTESDQLKTEQYDRKIKRDIQAEGLDLKSYIKSLQITVDVIEDDVSELKRYHQLTAKTNQFNLTTRRYQLQELEEFLNEPDVGVFALRYADKFGDEGIVGLAIVRYDGGAERAHIDTFLLSCRVLGRDVEHAFMDKILKAIRRRGMTSVTAEFVPTPKNRPASGFYEKCGFTAKGEHQYRAPIDDLVSNNYRLAS